MDPISTPPSPPPLSFRPILSAKQHYKKNESSVKSLLFSLFFIFLIVLGLVFLMSLKPDSFGNLGKFGKIEKGIEKPDPYVMAYENAKSKMGDSRKMTEMTVEMEPLKKKKEGC